MNFVINATAEPFSAGAIRRDMRRDVATGWYVLALACEPVSEVRQQKLRAILVSKDVLDDFPYHDSAPKLEKEWHDSRIFTLRQMALAYEQAPDRFALMEICT